MLEHAGSCQDIIRHVKNVDQNVVCIMLLFFCQQKTDDIVSMLRYEE